MPFTTANAAEMRAKRGRPPEAKKITAPHQAQAVEAAPEPSAPAPAPAVAVDAAPRAERMIPLVLKTGWWAYDGTCYMDAAGTQQVYRTPIMENGQVDEMARKRLKFDAGTRIEVSAAVARVLTSGGKATLDDSL